MIVLLAVRKVVDAATVRAVILQKINNDVLKKNIKHFKTPLLKDIHIKERRKA